MGKRKRRCIVTVDGNPITGARDFKDTDESEYNRDRGDDEVVGDQVRMTTGPFGISFEMLASDANVLSGMIGTLIVEEYEVERNPSTETVSTVTRTYTQGNFNVGDDAATDGPGRISVEGNFKTRVLS